MKNWLIIAISLVISFSFILNSSMADEFCVNSAIGLQTALETAESNDENDVIKVQQGLYTGNFEHFSAEGKDITVLGGYTANCSIRVVDPANTVLQGNGDSIISFLILNGGDITIEGLTLKKGNTSLGNGGGLYAGCSSSGSGNASNITVKNNIISENSAMQGGGMSILTSSSSGDSGNITIKNNIISGNSVEFGGGGVDAQSTSFAGASGYILFENNIVKMNSSNGAGGGLSILSRSTSGIPGNIKILHNTILENTSSCSGGGVWAGQGGPQPCKIIIKYNLISGNISEGSCGGGGISASCTDDSGLCKDIIITDNLITNNTSWAGGGVEAISLGDVIFTNNTIYNNTASYGGGIFFLMGDSDLFVYNNIIWGNSSDSLGNDINIQISGSPAGSSYGYNNDYAEIYGNWTNSGNNINKTPLFSDAANGDYHLAESSPCIDAGINTAPEISNVDFEGNLRIHDGDNNGTATVDMGAYEYGSVPIGNAAKAMPWIPLLLLGD